MTLQKANVSQYTAPVAVCGVWDAHYRAQSVHARHGVGHLWATGGVALALRRVLDCFHDKKRERGMDEALERLYQPIL